MGTQHQEQLSPNSTCPTSPMSNSLEAPSSFNDTAIELTLVSSSMENIENSRLPDVVAETKIFENNLQNKETYFSIAIQVFIPFLVAGFGMVGAGLVLDLVQVTFISSDSPGR